MNDCAARIFKERAEQVKKPLLVYFVAQKLVFFSFSEVSPVNITFGPLELHVPVHLQCVASLIAGPSA